MIEAVGSVPAEVLEAVEALVAGQKTLEDVVRWALVRKPPRLVEQVVVQDEYTHDVVLPWSAGIYLVYDTT